MQPNAVVYLRSTDLLNNNVNKIALSDIAELIQFIPKFNTEYIRVSGRPRPVPTARSDWLLKQSAKGSRVICFKGPAARHGQPSTAPATPRPALTDFWNNRRKESVLFVSRVPLSGPSRTSVHGLPPVGHGPFWRTSETIGARNPCRLFQKSISAARHGRPSTACPRWATARSDGLLKQSV